MLKPCKATFIQSLSDNHVVPINNNHHHQYHKKKKKWMLTRLKNRCISVTFGISQYIQSSTKWHIQERKSYVILNKKDALNTVGNSVRSINLQELVQITAIMFNKYPHYLPIPDNFPRQMNYTREEYSLQPPKIMFVEWQRRRRRRSRRTGDSLEHISYVAVSQSTYLLSSWHAYTRGPSNPPIIIITLYATRGGINVDYTPL